MAYSTPTPKQNAWKTPSFEAVTSPVKGADVEIVAVRKGAKVPAYGSLTAPFKEGDSFFTAVGGNALFWFEGKKGGKHVLFVWLGADADLTDEKARTAGGLTWGKLVAEKFGSAVIHAESFADSRTLLAFVEGLAMPAYQINHYKTGIKQPSPSNGFKFKIMTGKSDAKALTHELGRIESLCEALAVTRDWSNEPSNFGTPEFYANQAKKFAAAHGMKCKILTEKDAEKEKMGLFLGVGQGSEREGRIVVLEYAPKGAKKTVCLVGKGVTFDSGGISIKPSMRMEEMKHDMTGAATLMGAILLAAKWKISNRVVAILAFTENMPDGDAIQPGNVLVARNGKTVEIINTDAEGRLILADVLDYAHEFKPDAIINAATLTGAVSIALGRYCCAVLGNDADLIEEIQLAGEASHERVWQLPLYDDYFEDMKSDFADMKNSANDSYGGTIRGGIFLKQFIRKGMPWAHLDIAATSYHIPHHPYLPKRGASGLYVRTVANFLERFGK